MSDEKVFPSPEKPQLSFDAKDIARFPQDYAALNKVILKDLNDYTTRYHRRPFYKYTKDDIAKYLADPERYERQLRHAVQYIYNASPHFRRIVLYFAGLSDLAYVISPYRVDPKKANVATIQRNYRRVMNLMSLMNVETQFRQILTVCFREDVYYGTIWEAADNITIQQLPSDYCKITEVEGNVPNVTFDFMYFARNGREPLLEFYPPEFTARYNAFKEDPRHLRWQVLDSPNSFAIKANGDILRYAMPPLAGVLREVFDIDQYRNMKLAKTAIENYAMLVVNLGINEDGDWQIPLEQAKQFYHNLDEVLPEEVGSVLTPMPIEKISFEKSNTGDDDTIAAAEQNLFTAAGVSALLFNNARASGSALLLSIKADQMLCYNVVKRIEDMVNRFIQSKNYGKYFKVTFLDTSPYNRTEMGDSYLKAVQYGFPTISMYAATQGLAQAELDSMSFLENDVLGLTDVFQPLQSSATISSDGNGATANGGAPEKDIDELTDAGEATREQQ